MEDRLGVLTPRGWPPVSWQIREACGRAMAAGVRKSGHHYADGKSYVSGNLLVTAAPELTKHQHRAVGSQANGDQLHLEAAELAAEPRGRLKMNQFL